MLLLVSVEVSDTTGVHASAPMGTAAEASGKPSNLGVAGKDFFGTSYPANFRCPR